MLPSGSIFLCIVNFGLYTHDLSLLFYGMDIVLFLNYYFSQLNEQEQQKKANERAEEVETKLVWKSGSSRELGLCQWAGYWPTDWF